MNTSNRSEAVILFKSVDSDCPPYRAVSCPMDNFETDDPGIILDWFVDLTHGITWRSAGKRTVEPGDLLVIGSKTFLIHNIDSRLTPVPVDTGGRNV